MPNTPALIGQGIAGLYARGSIDAAARAEVEAVLAPTGRVLWFEAERDLDAVTALSGSGPAYVFFVAEAMVRAAVEMGLTPEQGRELALQTFAGATALAQGATEPLHVLRERVTSKGGTTHAAITGLQRDGVDAAFVGGHPGGTGAGRRARRRVRLSAHAPRTLHGHAEPSGFDAKPAWRALQARPRGGLKSGTRLAPGHPNGSEDE